MGLKVVALISGGKDSFFSLLHCHANGHEVVALANLFPSSKSGEDAEDDLDSFMYQTVGHSVIPIYEQALGLPLYRQHIVGSAVDNARAYGTNVAAGLHAQDETEDLVPLLLKVKQAQPEVNAVSTGAILSDYQRTRVESVALRLGLAPLSYLWQWPRLPPCTPASLLDDMAAVGQDSRIIKVASGGLDESFLWTNVAARPTIARLKKASEMFGSYGDGAVLGEGGEYETLALAGPKPLWKARIEVDDAHRHTIPGEAGSASEHVSQAYLTAPGKDQRDVGDLRKPYLYEDKFETILTRLLEDQEAVPVPAAWKRLQQSERSETTRDQYFGLTGQGPNVAAQTKSIMEQLPARWLEDTGADMFSSITYTSIILQNISDFAAVNEVYGSYFTLPLPPARATVACAGVLPRDVKVMFGFTLSPRLSSAPRHGLHVQSRSYWAPANIGPYSQATTMPCNGSDSLDELVFVAGQIPLEPASMELRCRGLTDYRKRFAEQTVLSLQHMKRIGDVMNVVEWAAVLVFVATSAEEDAHALVSMAVRAWTAHHEAAGSEEETEDDETFDVWYATQKPAHMSRPSQATSHVAVSSGLPPMWVVKVDTLPRGANIEWVGYGRTKLQGQGIAIPHLQYLLCTFAGCVLWSSDGIDAQDVKVLT
ncbi:hypothetical protein LTR62_003769 [Meristemomyces frigidus]|uniref:Diphthine--ammonia ligase n=1 Tax=Meristemomyces frigidus TaxID=1508187 RepID=A0AAN7TRH3_9PEZI|nr:hypothetical protein LTR62_003769 [Meristemomyces frigidus]